MLKGKTILVTGASRGIGAAIAERCARDGANLVLTSKTVDPHPKLAGTLGETAKLVEAAGGKALVVQADVRFEDAMEDVVAQAVKKFGGVDVVINNAGAISLTNLDMTSMKKFDLMIGVNVRATYLLTKCCVEHLRASAKAGRNPHVLNLAPPLSLEPRWLEGHTAYTISKYGMSLCTLGLGAELREDGIAVNSLWPRTAIATAAVEMLLGEHGMQASRKPEIMADAAHAIVTTEGMKLTGRLLLDDEILKERGVTEFDGYLMMPGVEPLPDLYVDPE